MNVKDKKVAVIGLGIEGKDLISYLQKKEADVTLLDAKPESELDLTSVDSDRLTIKSGETYLDSLSEFEIVFRSPGVYPLKPELVKAREKGVVVSSAIKLFFEECSAKIIGVTGTKGKGTTSTLIYDILKQDGKDVYLAGNIGKPYLSLLPNLKPDSWIILELSSFQLMDLRMSPHVAVVLNISTDHLDWHKDRNEYLEAKKSIVRFQSDEDMKIINVDYTDSKSFSSFGSAKTFYFSRKNEVEGCFIQDNEIILATNGQREHIGSTADLLLRGEHNWENVTAAIAATGAINVSLDSIRNAVFAFKGLEHRLELVRQFEGISYYNDSFATGPDTVRAAAASFIEPLTLIVGGFDKGLDYHEMARDLASRKDTNIVLIGDIANQINTNLVEAHFSGIIENIGKASMKEIVTTATKITPQGGVVVLSPGSSSFDMFASYKERGNLFKAEVHSLINE